MLRVLHVLNLNSFGGIQKICLELCEELNSHDFGQHSILSTAPIDLLKDQLPHNVKVIAPLNSSKIKQLLMFIKQIRKYDIIHLHGPYPLHQFFLFLTNKKVVYTEHGTLQKANIKRNIKHFIQKKLIGISFLKIRANAIVFVSHWLKKDLNINEDKSYVIHNGLKYAQSKYEKSHEFTITIAARLIPKKRVDMAIDVMNLLSNYSHIKLQVIGEGPEMERLERKAGNLKDKTIFFLGYRKDAYDLIAASQVYLMTTQMEPFGLVILEAMMSKTIVLAMKDSGGGVEILSERFPELIVASIDELAKSIILYYSNPELINNIGKGLELEYRENYTIEAMAQKYWLIYKNQINSEK
jgi:glycosyltransferase involved in cell wall biosynthesis